MTLLAALRHNRVEARWLLDGPINGERFQVYVEKVLVPTFKPSDIVIMDNTEATRARSSAKQLAQPAPGCPSCANTRQT